jgi:adenylosuccinate lyase
LKADPEVRSRMTDSDLAEAFDPAWHFIHVDTIFTRVFGDQASAT